MKVVIAGSRSISCPACDHRGYDPRRRNAAHDEKIHQIVEDAIFLCGFHLTEVVSGTARGVDSLGEWWAESRGIPVLRFPADWAAKGKVAGFVRNQQMAEACDAAIVIWDGESRGSAHMAKIAKALGKPVFVYHAPISKAVK